MTTAILFLFLFQPAAGLKAEARGKLQQEPLNPAIEQLLQQAIAVTPTDAEAHYLYGQWAILNHQEELAIGEEKRAIALSGNNLLARMQAYTLIGVAEDTLDHEAKAQAAFQKSRLANAQLPHPDARTLNEYAAFLLKRGKPAEAEQIAVEVLHLDPDLGAAHLIRAKLLERSGKRDAALAEAELAAAHAADPGEERAARAFLARSYFAAGNSEKARFNQKWVEENH